jgi:hypothetical protein
MIRVHYILDCTASVVGLLGGLHFDLISNFSVFKLRIRIVFVPVKINMQLCNLLLVPDGKFLMC